MKMIFSKPDRLEALHFAKKNLKYIYIWIKKQEKYIKKHDIRSVSLVCEIILGTWRVCSLAKYNIINFNKMDFGKEWEK